MSKATAVNIKPWVSVEELTAIMKKMAEVNAKLSSVTAAATVIAEQYPRTKFSLGTTWHMNGSCKPITIVGALHQASSIPSYPAIFWNKNGTAEALWITPTALHDPRHEDPF